MYDLIIDSTIIGWSPLDFSGVSMKILWQDERTGAMTVMTKMAPGAVIPAHRHTRADETVFVIEGDFAEGKVEYGPGSFFVGTAGTDHGPHGSAGGCVVLTTFSAQLDFILAE